jgi:hypothetical protein
MKFTYKIIYKSVYPTNSFDNGSVSEINEYLNQRMLNSLKNAFRK